MYGLTGRRIAVLSATLLIAGCANFTNAEMDTEAAESLAGGAARYGINFYSPKDWNRQQIFLNVMKFARPWISQSAGKWDDKRPLEMDEHGYVKKLQPGQWAATLMLTNVTESFPGGEYVFLYEGEGEFEWKGNGRLISSEPGRQIVNVSNTDNGFVHMMMKSTNSDNYARNMRFVKAEFEHELEEKRFSPWLFELWGDADTFRFMDLTLTNNSKLSEWSGRPKPEDRSYNQHGIAWEEVILLCNKAKRNAWINIPHLATDDFIRETAIMMRDQLDPALTVYYEFSNEVWNGMFTQTRYANEQGKKLELAPESWKGGLMFFAQECKRMFAILDEVYEGQPEERYRKVIGVQGANLGAARVVVESFDVAGEADCLAIAPYLTFNVPVKPSRWNPDMPTVDVAQDWTLDQLFEFLENKAMPQCMRWMEQQKELADIHGLELLAYEGGQHLTALGEANKNRKLIDLMAAANRDPRMGQLYRKYLGHWTKVGGGLFCLFNAMQPYTQHGSWGLLEYVGQDPSTSPKYMAVKEWAAGLKKE